MGEGRGESNDKFCSSLEEGVAGMWAGLFVKGAWLAVVVERAVSRRVCMAVDCRAGQRDTLSRLGLEEG